MFFLFCAQKTHFSFRAKVNLKKNQIKNYDDCSEESSSLIIWEERMSGSSSSFLAQHEQHFFKKRNISGTLGQNNAIPNPIAIILQFSN